MKKLFAVIIMLGGLLSCYPAPAEVVDKIEVIVNDEMITRLEIDRLLAPIYEKYKTMYTGDTLISRISEARQRIIEQLIEDKLVYSEAKKYATDVDEKDMWIFRPENKADAYQRVSKIKNIIFSEIA